MNHIQRTITILIGGSMVAYLLTNVRAQETSVEPMEQVEEQEIGYPVVSDEELANL